MRQPTKEEIRKYNIIFLVIFLLLIYIVMVRTRFLIKHVKDREELEEEGFWKVYDDDFKKSRFYDTDDFKRSRSRFYEDKFNSRFNR